MTRLRKMMLEELQRRNYSQRRTRATVNAVKQYADYFGLLSRPARSTAPSREFQAVHEKRAEAGCPYDQGPLIGVTVSLLQTLRHLTCSRHSYPKTPVKLPRF